MTSLPLKLFLVVAGLAGVALGAAILLAPVAFYASYGLDLTGQVTLLNEMRGHGLSLVAAGLFIGGGAAVSRFATTATLVAAILYLSYGLSRLVALVLDGRPADGLVTAMAVELAIGAISAFIYLSRRNRGILATP